MNTATVRVVVGLMALASHALALDVYGVPAVEKVLRDQAPSVDWTAGTVALECAGNEWEAFQVVVRTDAPAQVSLRVGDLAGPDGHSIPAAEARAYRVEWVDVNAPYALDEVSETPDLRPDPLVPLRDPAERFAAEPGRNTVFWLSVHVPEGAPAGDYAGAITLETEAGEAVELAVRLRVRGFSLPRRPILQSMISVAVANIYKAHGARTPEQQEQIIRLYFDEYIRARLSPFLYAPGTMAFAPLPEGQIKWRFVKGPDGKPTGAVTLDFTGFDREAERYLNERQAFSAFNFAPYLWGRQDRDGKQEMVLRITDADGTAVVREDPPGQVNPVYDELVVNLFRGIAAHLAEKGWLDRAIYYVTDEPSDSDTPGIKQICELVRRADPRIRTSLTYDPASRPRLAELVDADGKSLISVWIPYCSQYREAVAAEQRSKGADYWLYDVKESALISHGGLKNRGIFWETWDRDAKGYLYYLSTWWGREATPWVRPSFLLPEFTYQYRHGDGYFFYPPTVDGAPQTPILDYVVPTIRWELMREGAEDFDYLRMLEGLVEEAEARNLAGAAQGRAALAQARAFAREIASPANSYSIRELQFDAKDGWSAGLEEGWLHHRGGAASDLPIRVATDLPDGPCRLMLNVYDDRDYRGRLYSRFLVDGRPYASPGSNLKGPETVDAGLVEVKDGVCTFTLSSVAEEAGVIVYRVGMKRVGEDATGGLYEARSAVGEAIEVLTAALAEG